MRLVLVALLAACGSKAKPADKPADPAAPKHTVEPPLGGWSSGPAPGGTAPTPTTRATVDPPLGGWSTGSSPAPAPPPPTTTTSSTAPAKPGSTKTTGGTSTAAAGTGTSPTGAGSAAPTGATDSGASAGSGAPTAGAGSPPSPPSGPPPTLAAATGSNSCAMRGRTCHVTGSAAVATPAATGRGTVGGLVSVTGEHLPACPIDLVDGPKRITSGTLSNGKYELSAMPGHYSVSFERCLGCDPGLVGIDVIAGGAATVNLDCGK